MPTEWPDSSVVRVHAHSESVLCSSLGRVMGVGVRGGMTHVKKKHMTRRGLEHRTYRSPREYSNHLAIGPHGKPSNSTIYTTG